VVNIARVEAFSLNIPVSFAEIGSDRTQTNSMCLVEVEADDGTIGHGITSITQGVVITEIINAVAGPAIIGMDALAHEKVWNTLYWTCSPWGQSGYASHAISAIDVALWDIKGKALGEPVWRLLGGARNRVEAYVTCGFSFLDPDQLAESMSRMVAKGFKSVKMQVGRPGLDARRDPPPLVSIDAGCRLDLPNAVALARAVEAYDVSFFEEPIMQNDVHLLAEMRRQTRVRLSAGQNEGLAYRFRDMLAAGAVDVVQPNVIITGGITQCIKIAGMAAAHNVPISNGGGCPYHNMHLQAGVSNGTAVEYQVNSATACKAIFKELPDPEDGWYTLPDAPGLGLNTDMDAVRELSAG
jgi:L-alanine-DL-glutamate epimerase-like enolase superfamily enzyme